MLAALQIAAVVVDAAGRVRFVSPAAAGLLTRDGGLRLEDARLVAGTAQAQAALDRAIERAGGAVPSGSMLRLPGRTEAAPLVVLLAPHRLGEVLCLIRDPARDAVPSAEHVATALGLTGAEARLAVCLARGARLPAVAGRYGVSIATVRSQLSSLLAKAGCVRQADRVRLVLTLPVVGN